LFGALPKSGGRAPLAERVRPESLADVVGQAHLLKPHSPLRQWIETDRVRSTILWGPPGSGKTTLARVVAAATRSHFVAFSAVTGSVGELREIVAAAQDRLTFGGQPTIVFVDEIHRFNKGQQDAFLPHVEDGTIVLIGATTENPSFAVNSALLSRCETFHLEPLSAADVVHLLERAVADESRGLGALHLVADAAALEHIAQGSSGDARRALSTLEITADWAVRNAGGRLSLEAVTNAQSHKPLVYDKAGEEHYNVISAFIKSMRGSDPDAAVYWMMRMLEAGEEPLFVSRRMLIFASEDVGNADPKALPLAAAADETLRRVGMPEATYALSQACLYLACAPKSNASTVAWQRAKDAVQTRGALQVPRKLRNAVTPLMRADGYGVGYQYPHDLPEALARGETYLPDELEGSVFYEPTDRGDETVIKNRLAEIRSIRDK
jgi:putative ATPase